MRFKLAVFLLFFASAAAGAGRTNRVAIGTLTYLGTNEFGSAFRVALDPSALTSQSLSFASVTLFVAALKPVIAFPYASSAVRVFAPVNAAPLVCGLVNATAN